MIKKTDRFFSLEDVRKLLRLTCEGWGGQQAWAQAHGISRRFIWGTITGKHPPTRPILKALGLEAVTTYRKSR